MAKKSTSTKSNKKRTSHRVVDASQVTDPHSLTTQVLSQAEVGGEVSRKRRIFLSPILMWFLGLSAGLILVGLWVQDIPQPGGPIRWLIYRRGYPYFQSISLSALLVAASVVIPSAALAQLEKIDPNHWIARLLLILLERLQKLSSVYRSNRFWKVLFGLSVASFVASLWFPQCLSPKAILVSFDIFENGSLVRHVFPGETIVYDPARYIEIEAKVEANLFNLPSPRVTCEWTTSTGDGRLLQGTNCKINYQTGSDGRSDPVVVSIIQNGCPASFGFHSFFVSKAE